MMRGLRLFLHDKTNQQYILMWINLKNSQISVSGTGWRSDLISCSCPQLHQWSDPECQTQQSELGQSCCWWRWWDSRGGNTQLVRCNQYTFLSLKHLGELCPSHIYSSYLQCVMWRQFGWFLVDNVLTYTIKNSGLRIKQGYILCALFFYLNRFEG